MEHIEYIEQAVKAWHDAEGQDGVVRSARQRSDAARYELARLTTEHTYEKDSSEPQDGRVSLQQWAADLRAAGVELTLGTLRKYRVVWQLYGRRKPFERPSWRDAWAEAVPHDSPEAVAARRRLSESRNASPETKREIFRQLATDPAVIQDAVSLGSGTSQALSNLYRRSNAVRHEQDVERTQADPLLKRLDEIGASLDIEQACSTFAKELARLSERFARDVNATLPRAAIPRADGLHAHFVRRSVAQARAALDAIEGYVDGNDTDLDVFLAGVLEGTR